MTQEETLAILRETGALLEGHFLLSSGLHSGFYFQCALALQYPEKAELLARGIAEKLPPTKFDGVISPAIGGIVIGQEVARLLGVRAIFAEREDGKMTLRRAFSVKDGERFLVVEDVVTTGKSTKEVMELLKSKGGIPFLAACIVNRSSEENYLDIPLVSLVRLQVKNYPPGNCPLCERGVPIIKPGSR